MAESKYQKYVFKEPTINLPPRKPTEGFIVNLNENMMSGFQKIDCNFNFVGVLAPHVLADPPHKHDCDELLFFFSADPSNPVDLGGEVEIALGEDWEKQVVNTSAIICLPSGVQHCPIHVKKVDRPFYFGHCLLASKYGSDATPAE
ncbi:MAG: hypothetical protein JXA46_10120 [Dehalococcoidales bacterium]|nr:hypothetical protein [Dehalococcoidales bacterium]